MENHASTHIIFYACGKIVIAVSIMAPKLVMMYPCISTEETDCKERYATNKSDEIILQSSRTCPYESNVVVLLVISSFAQPGPAGHCLINGYYVVVGNRKHKAVVHWHTNLSGLWRKGVGMRYLFLQDCSISIANALEILQSCIKPLICSTWLNRMDKSSH